MGSSFAPSYVPLLTGFWEDTFIHNSHNNRFLSKISLWNRYIDDILFFWNGITDELMDFLKNINSTTHSCFTAEHSEGQFFRLNHLHKCSRLDSTIYQKLLSRNTLLRADSHHPQQLIKNIPVGQFLSLKRNCSTDEEFEVKAAEKCERFQNRGYKENDTRAAYQRAMHTDEVRLLQKNKHSTPPHLCFSTEFSPMEK